MVGGQRITVIEPQIEEQDRNIEESNIVTSVDMAGVLSKIDINQALKEKEIVICNIDYKKLSPAGYDLSFSNFFYSTKYNILYKIYKEGRREYVKIAPGDTVLTLTNEAIWISSKYAGTIHSMVGMCAKGISNISTTVDPNWEGPLLITFSNCTNHEIILDVSNDEEYETFATLIIYKLITPVRYEHPKAPGRRDILNEIADKLREKNEKKYKKVIDSLTQVSHIVKSDIKIGSASGNKTSIEKIGDFNNKYEGYVDKLFDAIKDAVDYSNKKDMLNKGMQIGIKVIMWVLFAGLIVMNIFLWNKNIIDPPVLVANITAILIAVISIVFNLTYR